MSVRVTIRRGSFNLCNPSEVQWVAGIYGLPEDAPRRSVDTTWPEEDEPPIDDDTPPSVAVEEIAERIESFLLDTGRERARETIRWIRENAESVDADWARGRLPTLRARAEGVAEQIRHMEQLCGEVEADPA